MEIRTNSHNSHDGANPREASYGATLKCNKSYSTLQSDSPASSVHGGASSTSTPSESSILQQHTLPYKSALARSISSASCTGTLGGIHNPGYSESYIPEPDYDYDYSNDSQYYSGGNNCESSTNSNNMRVHSENRANNVNLSGKNQASYKNPVFDEYTDDSSEYRGDCFYRI